MTEDYPAYLPGLEPGSMLAGYRLEARVGAGGMAVVYRARDERLRRLVALKVLAPELVSDTAFRRRFIAESLAAAAVDDPHIIPVYEAGEADGMLFIAMRFVHGGDLRLVLQREGALAPARTAEYISPVASALDAAHLSGLVHRDIKPGNILVDTRPGRPDHVYLSDFGISKGAMTSLTMAGPLTATGQFFGTPGYSAPEQIEALEVDGRADQYSLACVTYELLTGDTPFQRHSVMAVLIAHVQDPPPPLTSRRPDLPAAVDSVMAKALAKTSAERYATCADFADALRDALRLPPYHARGHPEAAPYPLPPGSSAEPRSPSEPASPIGSRAPTEISWPSEPRSPTETSSAPGISSPAEFRSPTEIASPAVARSPTEIASPAVARSPTEISAPDAGPSPTGTIPRAAVPAPVKRRTPAKARTPTVGVSSPPITPASQPPTAPGEEPAALADVPAADDPVPATAVTPVHPAEPAAPQVPDEAIAPLVPTDAFASAEVDETGEAETDEAQTDEAQTDEAEDAVDGQDSATLAGSGSPLGEPGSPREVTATFAAAPPAETGLPTIAGTSQDELADTGRPTMATPIAAGMSSTAALADAVPDGTVDSPESVADQREPDIAGAELPRPGLAEPEPDLPAADLAEPGLAEPGLPEPDLQEPELPDPAPADLRAADLRAVIAAKPGGTLDPAEEAASVAVIEPDVPGSQDGAGAAPEIAVLVTRPDRGAVKTGKRQERDWRRRLPAIAAISALAGAAAVVVPLMLKSSPAGSGHPANPPGPSTSASATPSSSHQTLAPQRYTPVLLHDPVVTGNPVDSLAFNPAGTMLAIAAPNRLCVWDLSTARCARVFTSMFAVAFSPDGTTLAGVQEVVGSSGPPCGDPDGLVRLWNVGTGHEDASFCDTSGTTAISGGALSVAFSPDGNMLAVGDGDGDTYLWNVRTGKPVVFVTRPGEIAVNEVAFSPNGSILAVGDMNGSTYLWRVNASTGTVTFITVVTGIRNTDMNTAGVTGLAFSHDGSRLAVGETVATTHLTYLWNASTWKPAAAPLSDPGGSHVTAVAFAPDGSTLAVADGNGTVYLWNSGSGTLLTRLSDPDGAPLIAVAFSSYGAALATSDQAGNVYYWSKSLASITI